MGGYNQSSPKTSRMNIQLSPIYEDWVVYHIPPLPPPSSPSEEIAPPPPPPPPDSAAVEEDLPALEEILAPPEASKKIQVKRKLR
jgi:hypothetical protein